jgi:hypothetical protein
MKNTFSYMAFMALVCILPVVLIIGSCTTSAPSPLPPSETPPTTTLPEPEPETESVSPTTSAPSYETIHIEETDPSFEFSDGWRKEKDERASGGSWAISFRGYSNVNIPKVDIKFRGTGISLVHVTGPFCGIADVKIDGKDYPSIDAYAANPQNTITSIATDLTYDDHIMTISPSWKSNPAADVTTAEPKPGPPKPIIYVDAVEIIVPK